MSSAKSTIAAKYYSQIKKPNKSKSKSKSSSSSDKNIKLKEDETIKKINNGWSEKEQMEMDLKSMRQTIFINERALYEYANENELLNEKNYKLKEELLEKMKLIRMINRDKKNLMNENGYLSRQVTKLSDKVFDYAHKLPEENDKMLVLEPENNNLKKENENLKKEIKILKNTCRIKNEEIKKATEKIMNKNKIEIINKELLSKISMYKMKEEKLKYENRELSQIVKQGEREMKLQKKYY